MPNGIFLPLYQLAGPSPFVRAPLAQYYPQHIPHIGVCPLHAPLGLWISGTAVDLLATWPGTHHVCDDLVDKFSAIVGMEQLWRSKNTKNGEYYTKHLRNSFSFQRSQDAEFG